jgi:uncharacterized protein (DUF1684 family)
MFELAGHVYQTKPFLDAGELLLVFADRTSGKSSKAPGRFLMIAPPASGLTLGGPVTLDFNRAVLPPCAFSDEFNCPLPPAEHRFETAVIAGERWVRWRGR